MTDISHVHANLMRPPRQEAALQQRIRAEPFLHPKLRRSLLAVLPDNRHLLTVLRAAADRAVNDAFRFLDISLHES